jgi:hypothetical protein
VLAALGEVVWSGLVVTPEKCAIDGRVVCALDDRTVVYGLDDALCLFVFLEVDFVDMLGTVEVSAVAGDMI